MKRSTLSGVVRSLRVFLAIPVVIGAVCLILAEAPSAMASVTVAHYTFPGDSLASSTNSYATATDITSGTGFTGEFDTHDGGNPEYGSDSGNLPLTEAAAVTTNCFISFTVTPTSGTMSYNSVSFNINSYEPENATTFDGTIIGRSSVDNFTSDLFTETAGPLTGGGNDEETGGGGPLSFPPESGAVTFRLYFYDNQNDDSINILSVSNIAVVATPVPEPGTWADVVLSVAGLMVVVKRRRSCAG